jgi:hypothetical protein
MAKGPRLVLFLVLGSLLAAGCARGPLPEAPAPGEPVALQLDPESQYVTVTDPTPTVSAIWDRALQEAIVEKGPGPTVAARAAAILHAALYDVWASHDPVATASAVGVGDAFQRRPEIARDEAARDEAMSHAAYVLLSGMFPENRERFDRLMRVLGYDPYPGELYRRPSGLGRVIAMRVMGERRNDGSNWDDGFEDWTGYEPVNPGPMQIRDITRWTPENTPIDPEDPEPDQDFLTPQWARLEGIFLDRPEALRPPPPQPFFRPGVEAALDVEAGTVSFADGRSVAVTRDLVGPVINPGFIAQAERVVRASAALTDRTKLIAEFWEDNKDTAFPPGTWLTFAQYVSARDDHTVDEDAPLFFAMAAAMHDAAIATWEAKVHYDYVRPVRAIRTLGRLGLIGRRGVDDLTGEEGHVVEAWGGPGQGTRTVLARRFLSYQNPEEDPSPPFAEYPSGHSAFSAAAAEVLRAFTGSDRFGGSVGFAPGSSRFEPGITPRERVTLRWETFSEAADEAGISRIHGGIHFDEGDLEGRRLGREVGRRTVERVRALLAGRRGS